MLNREYAKVDNQEIPVYLFTNDVNGNPRYLVHFLAIGLADHVATDKTRKAGLRIFHGRAFGGGFVFQSYNIHESMAHILKTLAE